MIDCTVKSLIQSLIKNVITQTSSAGLIIVTTDNKILVTTDNKIATVRS